MGMNITIRICLILNFFNMTTRFSIITVSYNSGKTIERTIRSVLNQTFSDYEYIIIDGASSDNTIDIIRKYEAEFGGRLKWVSEPDKGIYNAMNKGINMSSGAIIGIVNSDDYWEPNTLQEVVNEYQGAHNPDNSIYCGWIKFHYNDGSSQLLKTDYQTFVSWARYFEVAGVRHPAVFVPKKVYEENGVFDENLRVMSDSDLLLRFYFAHVDFRFIDMVLSNMSDGGVSNMAWKTIFEDYKKLLAKYKLKRVRYFLLLLRWKSREYLKYLMPNSLLRFYRKYSKA